MKKKNTKPKNNYNNRVVFSKMSEMNCVSGSRVLN